METQVKNDQWLQALCEGTKRALKPIPWRDGQYLGLDSRKASHFVIEQCADKDFLYNGYGLLWSLKNRINGANFDGRSGKLIVPASDRVALIIHHACKGGKLKFKDQAVFTLYQALLMRWQLYYQSAKLQADFKLKNNLSDRALSLPERAGVEAGLYQRAAVDCALSVPGYAFFMEQGAGKTYPAIMAMEQRARNFNNAQFDALEKDYSTIVKPFHVLIIAPKAVCPNWENELDVFSYGKGKVISLHGGKIARTKRIMDTIITPSITKEPLFGYDWVAVVMSYGLLDNDIDILSYVNWDLSILDESHYIKNARAKRTVAAMKLRDQCESRLIMTGTPMPNGARDLYAQLEYLGEGYSGHTNAQQFASAYSHLVEYKNNGQEGAPISKFVGVKNKDELQEKLSTIAFMITKKEALPNLPNKTYDVVGVDMTKEQTAYYKKALNHIVIECEASMSDAEGDAKRTSMVLQNILKRMMRLSQITSGFFVTDDICDDYGEVITPGETYRFDPNPKIEELIKILKAKPVTEKTIVWSNWLQDIATIKARLEYEKIGTVVLTGKVSRNGRKKVIRSFNEDPDCLVYLGNPAAGGIGVNLLGHADEETNCNQVIVYCQNWNAAIRPQSEDRAHRRGTRCHIQITDLVVPGTVDQRIREVVTGKRTISNQMQNVREIMQQLVLDTSEL